MQRSICSILAMDGYTPSPIRTLIALVIAAVQLSQSWRWM
jgi:hypothetical protein